MNTDRSTYFLPNSSIEVARLVNQDRSVTSAVSLLPEEVPGGKIFRVLDIGCGPGVWLLDMVTVYPHIRGTGIDISQEIVTMANLFSQAEGREGLTFLQMDARRPLLFDSLSFDYIQMRLNHSFLHPLMWSGILNECSRLLVPGGWLRVVDLEIVLANTPAAEQFHSFLPTVWSKAHLSFSTDGRSMGILAQLSSLLKEAGLVQRHLRLYPVDASADSKDHFLHKENSILIFEGIKAILIAQGGYSADFLAGVLERALIEMEQPDYTCFAVLFSYLYQKP